MTCLDFGPPLWWMPPSDEIHPDCLTWPEATTALEHARLLAEVTDDPHWQVDVRCIETAELPTRKVPVLTVWSEDVRVLQLLYLWPDLTAGRIAGYVADLTLARFERAHEDIARRARELQEGLDPYPYAGYMALRFVGLREPRERLEALRGCLFAEAERRETASR